MHRCLISATLACALVASPAFAASLSKSYAYFVVTGKTVTQLERSLSKRGPRVGQSSAGHPGATELRFTGDVKYGELKGKCRIEQARYHVRAKVILPRWRNRPQGDKSLVFVWDTLSSDIKRHEESHVIIAKNHAKMIEQKLLALRSLTDCKAMAKKVDTIVESVLGEHDAAQKRFDRIEAKSFESRLLRLLAYRLSREPAKR
jgi:predicted secreted Zn-dependent protease